MVAELQSTIPLNPLCKRWLDKLKLARKFKKRLFGDDAAEAMKFFHCGKELHELMWERHAVERKTLHEEEELPAPHFRIVVGKVAELVELFGPTLYHKNPEIVAQPKTLEIPNDLLFPLIDPATVQQAQMAAQQQGQPFDMASLIPPDPDDNGDQLTARLIQYYLNYVQFENDKKVQSRKAIDEALIKGAGILWTEVFPMYPGGPELVGSFYDTIDNLLIDMDAETLDEAWWCARKRVWPIWKVAERFKIDEKYLREKYMAHEGREEVAGEVEYGKPERTHNPDARRMGETNDVMEFWEIYSRMGIGTKQKGFMPEEADLSADQQQVVDVMEQFGENVYLAIADKIPYPLNFKTADFEALATEPDEEAHEQLHTQKLKDVSWPIPFWVAGLWPFTTIAFHDVPNSPWPMSHIKPGLGYLKFLNWVMSFMVNRLRHSLRTVAATMKSAGDELTEKFFSGKDFEVLELADNLGVGTDVNKLVSYLKIPDMNPDIWKVVDSVFALFDKATGLTEIMYGAAGGMRSAEEARIKGANSSVRVDDMGNKVEDAMSLVARKEGMAARWVLDEQSLAPVLGQRGTSLWMRFVKETDFEKVSREFHYRIAAGSIRKPDPESQANIINQAMQVIPNMLKMAENPQFRDIANFLISKWCEANNFDAKNPLIPEPVPQPNPMQQKIEGELELKKQEAAIKQQEMQVKLQTEQQKGQIQVEAIRAKAAAQTQAAQMDMQVKQQEAMQQIQLDREKAQHEMQMGHARTQQELQLAQIQTGRDIELGQLEALSKVQQQRQQAALAQDEHRQSMQHADESHKAEQARAAEQAKMQARMPKKNTGLGGEA